MSAAFWGNPSGAHLRHWLRTMREIGYEGATLFADFWVWSDRMGDGKEVAADLRASEMALASVLTRVDDDLDRYRRLADTTAQLGARHLEVIGGEGRGTEALSALAARLNRIGKVVREASLTLSFHHHTDTTCESFAETRALLDQTDPSLVSLAFDAGHATKDFTELPERDRATAAFGAFASRISFVEIKDWSPDTDLDTAVGAGTLDVAALFRSIGSAGYDDWIVVEQNDETARSPTEKARCAAKSLQAIRGAAS